MGGLFGRDGCCDDWIWWIIILIVIFCVCGDGFGRGCDCRNHDRCC